MKVLTWQPKGLSLVFIQRYILRFSILKLTAIACGFLVLTTLSIDAQTFITPMPRVNSGPAPVPQGTATGPGVGLSLCGAPNALCTQMYRTCTYSDLATSARWRRYGFQATCVCAGCGCASPGRGWWVPCGQWNRRKIIHLQNQPIDPNTPIPLNRRVPRPF